MNAKNTAYRITDRRHSCITIDRQYGNGSRGVGQILFQKLGIPFYDGELLLLVAERLGLSLGRLREKDETQNKSLLHGVAMFAGSLQNYGQMSEPYQIFEAMSETIRRLAMEGPVIFMGQCADTVLREVCVSLDIFIYASSMEERANRIRATDYVPTESAGTYIRRKDQQGREYYKMLAEEEWGKMEDYDMCLDTSSFGCEGCTGTIAAVTDHAGSGRKEE